MHAPKYNKQSLSLLPAKSLQSCLCATPWTAAYQASPSMGFSRQEHWSRLPFPSPMHEVESESEVTQSCLTLSNPMDCSLPGSSIHGIFQATVLEWGAIASSPLSLSIANYNHFSDTIRDWITNKRVSLNSIRQKLYFRPFMSKHGRQRASWLKTPYLPAVCCAVAEDMAGHQLAPYILEL